MAIKGRCGGTPVGPDTWGAVVLRGCVVEESDPHPALVEILGVDVKIHFPAVIILWTVRVDVPRRPALVVHHHQVHTTVAVLDEIEELGVRLV